jgi:hypothetical protein
MTPKHYESLAALGFHLEPQNERIHGGWIERLVIYAGDRMRGDIVRGPTDYGWSVTVDGLECSFSPPTRGGAVLLAVATLAQINGGAR